MSPIKLAALRLEIKKGKGGLSWRAYAQLPQFSALRQATKRPDIVLWQLVNKPGYEPVNAKIRLALNLPALKLAACCAECGEVHVEKKCPHQPAPTTRQRLRLIIDVTNQPELKDAVEELAQGCGMSSAAWMRQALIHVVANQPHPPSPTPT